MKDSKPTKNSSKAWFISDRSGARFHMCDGEKEPGTGYHIAKKESDGIYNFVDHPQAHLNKYAVLSGDPYPVENARPDIDHSVTQAQLDAKAIFDVLGNRIL